MNLNRIVWTVIPLASEGNNTHRNECQQMSVIFEWCVGSRMDSKGIM